MDLRNMANCIRALSMDAVQQANSGHPGMPMGMADVATVLFSKFLKYNPTDPDWADRDRFILSAGHGSMLLYSLLHLTGYKDFPLEQIKNFRQLGYNTAGHPEYRHGSGIETTTGPLGQGIATAIGMALAERSLRYSFGEDLVKHKTYVIAGDGCLMEGVSYEAVAIAGHHALNNLIVLWDNNSITIDGDISLSSSEDTIKRFQAANWKTISCDGHNMDTIEAALSQAQQTSKPTLIDCKTIIGKGSPNKQGTSGVHGSPLGTDEINLTRQQIGWKHPPFEIPQEIYADWGKAHQRNKLIYSKWQKCLADHPKKSEFKRRQSGTLPMDFNNKIAAYKNELVANKPTVATRKSGQLVLNQLLPIMPELLGGSADLTGSNLTKGENQEVQNKDNVLGNYIHYGIREHGMAAAMNGIALHGGCIPYGGTFLIFTDYCRPAIRLSALMNTRAIYIMTHDSIGLGEDGPTHQPVETIPALRAIPNLNIFRPCDTIETLECWEIALKNQTTKASIFALSRQNLPTLRQTNTKKNLCQQGGYVIATETIAHQTTIMASGSEVTIAMQAKEQLELKDIGTRVVSVPCLDIFAKIETDYRQQVLGNYQVLASIEAATTKSWLAFPERPDVIIGMQGFGASAPIDELYKHFGITSKQLVNKILQKLP